MLKPIFLLPVTLLLLLMGCSNYDEEILIGKEKFDFIYGVDGFIGDLIREDKDSLGEKVIADNPEGMIYVNDGTSLMNDTNDATVYYDTLGDTIIYRRPIFLSTGDSIGDVVMQLFFWGKKYSSTIKTEHPIVWSNANVVGEKEVQYSKRILTISEKPSKKMIIVKCLWRGEPNFVHQKKMIWTSKVKLFVQKVYNKLFGWAKRFLGKKKKQEQLEKVVDNLLEES